MGRININFYTGSVAGIVVAHPDAIPAKDLAMVLMSLPGDTYVTGCVTGITSYSSLQVENTVEAENAQFPDGTAVIPRYKRHATSSPSGSVVFASIFDGIDILIPPPSVGNTNLISGTANQSFGGGSTNPTPSTSPPPSSQLSPCQALGHNWTIYRGFVANEEYCSVCGERK